MKRNAFIDNAKVLFIFLVVFGHMIQPITAHSEMVNNLYLWIYVFHMPAFIMLSGFFARGSGQKNYLLKLAKKLIVPYLIFQGIYTLFYFLMGNESWQNGLFYPHWSLWFLISLFCWHLLLILYKRLTPLLGIAIAVLIGLAIGYISEVGHLLSLSRTFVFFPFFLIGYHLTNEKLMLVKKPIVRGISILIMVMVAIIIYYVPNLDSGWFLSSKSYAVLGEVEYGLLIRLLVYIGATVLTISILAWVPRKNLGWITEIGLNTLYIYLLHGFIIQTFRYFEWFQSDSILSLIGIAILSAIIVIALSSKFVTILFQPLVEGNLSRIKKEWRQREFSQ